MIYAFLVLFGLCLGSFVNALIWRLHEQSKYYDDEGRPKKLTSADKIRLRDLSISKGRSMCAKCGHQLSAVDLVPVFSWVALRGKCRYCKQKIDDTPIIEIALPLILVSSYWLWPFSIQSVAEYSLFGVWTLIMTCFVALAAYDAKWYLLPDRVVLPLTIFSVTFAVLRSIIVGDISSLYDAALGAAVISGLFWALYLLSKGEWIGFGDVKLALSLGLIVGAPLLAVLVIFIASLSGTVAALPQLFSRKKGIQRTIPFGPHLLLATAVVFLFGQGVVDWYFTLLSV